MTQEDRLTQCIPAARGSYALWLQISSALWLPVGRLGTFYFPEGAYLYQGSAFGPGGLRARLRHHFRISAQPHWHLDALRPHAGLLGGWYSTSAQRLECAWSRALGTLPGVTAPAPGFGASDCRSGCVAHLLAVPSSITWAEVEAVFRTAAGPGTVVVQFDG